MSCVTLMVFVCVILHTVYKWVLAMVYGQAPYEELWLIMWLSIVPLVLLLEKPKYVSHSCICAPLHSWKDPLWEEKVSEWKSLQSPKVSVDSSGQYSLLCLPCNVCPTTHCTDLFRAVNWCVFNIFVINEIIFMLQASSSSEQYHGKRTGLKISRNKDICAVFLQYSGLCSVCFRHGTVGRSVWWKI